MLAVLLGLAGSCVDPQGSPYSRQWSVLSCLCLVLVVVVCFFFFLDHIHQASSVVCSLSYQARARF